MAAFGDALLFLAVFGVAAVAATALASFGDDLASRELGAHATPDAWSALASLRVLLAPLFGLAWFVSAVMAPSRNPRVALLVATAIEASVFAAFVVILVRSP